MENLFDDLKLSLRTPSLMRTPKQIRTIISYMSNFAFFKTNIIPTGEDILHRTCELMTYDFFPVSQFVCRIGEPGDKFYVILKGRVRVLVKGSNDNSSEYEAGQLSDGLAFGEYALLHNQARIASIQCITDTHLAVLSKENYLNVIGRIEAKRLDDLAKFLRGFTAFRKWSKNPIIKTSYFFKEVTLPRKSVIFKEGDPTNEILFIKSGELELIKSMKSDKECKLMHFRNCSPVISRNVAILGIGETVGEELLTSEKHIYTCRVYSYQATFLVMSKADFCKRVRDRDSKQALTHSNQTKELVRNVRVNSAHILNESKSIARTEESDGETNKSYLKRRKRHNKITIRDRPIFDKNIGSEACKILSEKKDIIGIAFHTRIFESRQSKRLNCLSLDARCEFPMEIQQKGLYNRDEFFKTRLQSIEILNSQF